MLCCRPMEPWSLVLMSNNTFSLWLHVMMSQKYERRIFIPPCIVLIVKFMKMEYAELIVYIYHFVGTEYLANWLCCSRILAWGICYYKWDISEFLPTSIKYIYKGNIKMTESTVFHQYSLGDYLNSKIIRYHIYLYITPYLVHNSLDYIYPVFKFLLTLTKSSIFFIF
jgi:hypothetical protein